MFSLGPSHHEVASYNGGIQYCVVREWTFPPSTVLGHFDRSLHEDLWAIDRMNRSSTTASMGFVVTKGLLNGPAKVIHPFTLFRLPYWALLTPAAIILGILTLKIARTIIRARRGLCRNCGYDLREHASGACPECGAVKSGIRDKARQKPAIANHPVGV